MSRDSLFLNQKSVISLLFLDKIFLFVFKDKEIFVESNIVYYLNFIIHVAAQTCVIWVTFIFSFYNLHVLAILIFFLLETWLLLFLLIIDVYLQDSSLPCAVFVFTAINVSKEKRDVSISFTWTEVLGGSHKKKALGWYPIYLALKFIIRKF